MTCPHEGCSVEVEVDTVVVEVDTIDGQQAATLNKPINSSPDATHRALAEVLETHGYIQDWYTLHMVTPTRYSLIALLSDDVFLQECIVRVTPHAMVISRLRTFIKQHNVQHVDLTRICLAYDITTIDSGAFWGCTALTTVVIPDGVTIIRENAFRGCTALVTVVIPSGVTSICEGAFWGCTALVTVVIPSGVTHIGAHAFKGCTSLVTVVIPSGVTHIGAHAFQDCTSLVTVGIPSGVTHIGAHAFQDCTSLTR